MRIFNHSLLLSGNLSGSNTVNTNGVAIPHIDGYSVHVVLGAKLPEGVTASFKLQASNDKVNTNWETPSSNVTNWVDISGTTQVVSASMSAPSQYLWNVGSAFYSHTRLVATTTAGSGSLDVRVSGKAPS